MCGNKAFTKVFSTGCKQTTEKKNASQVMREEPLSVAFVDLNDMLHLFCYDGSLKSKGSVMNLLFFLYRSLLAVIDYDFSLNPSANRRVQCAISPSAMCSGDQT